MAKESLYERNLAAAERQAEGVVAIAVMMKSVVGALAVVICAILVLAASVCVFR